MQRYFLDLNNQISKDDTHHIINVMRFKSGTEVELCKEGMCYLADLVIHDKMVSFELKEKLSICPMLNITIVQGLPKGDKLETVTKYATLFNAKSILFMPMKRSIAKVSNASFKLERLHKISKEAAELSKRSFLPFIDFIDSINKINLKNKVLLILDEAEKENLLGEVVKLYKNEEIVAVIGPEGGIDDEERLLFKSLNAVFVSLGELILPTELAHIPLLNAFSL